MRTSANLAGDPDIVMTFRLDFNPYYPVSPIVCPLSECKQRDASVGSHDGCLRRVHINQYTHVHPGTSMNMSMCVQELFMIDLSGGIVQKETRDGSEIVGRRAGEGKCNM